ncbi:MAG TPA: helix-turn-helix domain-containing protein [Polyangiaceae bacterium]|jgi:DNA-binding transcriptional MerR regulator
MTAVELATKLGVSVRTVRFYVSERLLPAATFRGRATRYVREHLVRLAAIRKLQNDGIELRSIRGRLETLSYPELEALAATLLPELAQEGGSHPQPPASDAPNDAPLERAATQSTWQRIALLPGLELHVSSDASPHAARAAGDLAAQFRARGGSS